jgi:hypothetical protein
MLLLLDAVAVVSKVKLPSVKAAAVGNAVIAVSALFTATLIAIIYDTPYIFIVPASVLPLLNLNLTLVIAVVVLT